MVGTKADPAGADGTHVSCPLGTDPVPSCPVAVKRELAPRAKKPSKEKPTVPACSPHWVAGNPCTTGSLSCTNSCTCPVTQVAEMRGGKHKMLLELEGSLQKW